MLKKFMNTHPIQTYFIEDLILLLLVVAFNLVMGSTIAAALTNPAALWIYGQFLCTFSLVFVPKKNKPHL